MFKPKEISMRTRMTWAVAVAALLGGCTATPANGALQTNASDSITFTAFVPQSNKQWPVQFYGGSGSGATGWILLGSCNPSTLLLTDSANVSWYYCQLTTTIPTNLWVHLPAPSVYPAPPAGANYFTQFNGYQRQPNDASPFARPLYQFTAAGQSCASSKFNAGASGQTIALTCGTSGSGPKEILYARNLL
jgi:hypothetical protein